MSYQITSDNIDISPSMTELAKGKLEKLKHHLVDYTEDLISFRVVLNSVPKETFEAKVEAVVNGKSFFAHATHYSVESALVAAISEIDRQMQKTLKKQHGDDWEKRREQKRFSD